MRITAYVTGVIPVIAVAMRFASRWLGGNAFWWDDWIHFVSAVGSQTNAALGRTDDSVSQGLMYSTPRCFRTQHECGTWKAFMGLDISPCLRDWALE